MNLPTFPQDLLKAKFDEKTNFVTLTGPIIIGGSLKLPVTKPGRAILPGSVIDTRDDFSYESVQSNFKTEKKSSNDKGINSLLVSYGLKYKN